ncbi:ester cyclase [Candidatus Tisiphia endosymbiont of Mystacides longicornis]|uniref:ester cyclase n=1 Tax=Candidatus Tisiphia endosymbiont of Mystacides longicornis TaxID=3139330 RepID=UPI003CCB3532
MAYDKLKQISDFEHCFWNAKEVKEAKGLYSELFDEYLITESPLGKHLGHYYLQDTYLQWLEAFPTIKVHTTIFKAIDDLVFWEWESTCVHEGIFQGIKPTGKEISYAGKTMYQFNRNKITNYTCYLDILNIYNQLGYFLQQEQYDGQHIVKQDYYLLITKLIELTQNNDLKLTVREVEILSCWLFGRSLKSIGTLFNISPRTAEAHIEHIKYKLLCNSKYDLQNLINSKKIYHLFQDLYLLITRVCRHEIVIE